MTTIVDNATLTAVQRLLGEITIRDKSVIDGDILALESLLQTYLFSDKVMYVDDYKKEFRDRRKEYFNFLDVVDIDKNTYDDVLRATYNEVADIIPRIEGGFITDNDFKPFFEILRMNNIFTWDMSSSEYFLTQKMLIDPNNKIDIDKYNVINQMIFSEKIDTFEKNEMVPEPLLYDSKGNPIKAEYTLLDYHNEAVSHHISKSTEFWLSNLSWLAFRTIFYTLIASIKECNVSLHPIRHAFQIHYINKTKMISNDIFNNILSIINASAENTIKSIFKPSQSLILKYNLPMFSLYTVSISKDPKKIFEVIAHMRMEGDFVEARRRLDEINNLSKTDNKKSLIEGNKLIADFDKVMKRILEKYHVLTPQGIALSPMISVYNIGASFIDGMSTIPTFTGSFKGLNILKDIIPQRGFNGIYKSLINDLAQIGKLGTYHELLLSKVICEDKPVYTLKEEDIRFMRHKSYWKIPM